MPIESPLVAMAGFCASNNAIVAVRTTENAARTEGEFMI